jgi:hypothetical protein
MCDTTLVLAARANKVFYSSFLRMLLESHSQSFALVAGDMRGWGDGPARPPRIFIVLNIILKPHRLSSVSAFWA